MSRGSCVKELAANVSPVPLQYCEMSLGLASDTGLAERECILVSLGLPSAVARKSIASQVGVEPPSHLLSGTVVPHTEIGSCERKDWISANDSTAVVCVQA